MYHHLVVVQPTPFCEHISALELGRPAPSASVSTQVPVWGDQGGPALLFHSLTFRSSRQGLGCFMI